MRSVDRRQDYARFRVLQSKVAQLMVVIRDTLIADLERQVTQAQRDTP